VVTDTADLTGAKVFSWGEGGRSCQVYNHILNGTYLLPGIWMIRRDVKLERFSFFENSHFPC
jgi:hypothetical protein